MGSPLSLGEHDEAAPSRMIRGGGNGRHAELAEHVHAGRMEPFAGEPFVVRLGFKEQNAGALAGKRQAR